MKIGLANAFARVIGKDTDKGPVAQVTAGCVDSRTSKMSSPPRKPLSALPNKLQAFFSSKAHEARTEGKAFDQLGARRMEYSKAAVEAAVANASDPQQLHQLAQELQSVKANASRVYDQRSGNTESHSKFKKLTKARSDVLSSVNDSMRVVEERLKALESPPSAAATAARDWAARPQKAPSRFLASMSESAENAREGMKARRHLSLPDSYSKSAVKHALKNFYPAAKLKQELEDFRADVNAAYDKAVLNETNPAKLEQARDARSTLLGEIRHSMLLVKTRMDEAAKVTADRPGQVPSKIAALLGDKQVQQLERTRYEARKTLGLQDVYSKTAVKNMLAKGYDAAELSRQLHTFMQNVMNAHTQASADPGQRAAANDARDVLLAEIDQNLKRCNARTQAIASMGL